MALGQLPGILTTPLANAGSLISGFMSDAISKSAFAFGDAMGNLGDTVERLGRDLTQRLGTAVSTAFRLVLGTTIGGALGGALEGAIHLIGDNLSTLAGKLVNAVFNPIRNAIQGSLTDFDRWVGLSIQAQSANTRFEAVLATAGRGLGFTAQQLKDFQGMLAEGSPFGRGEIRDSMTEMMRFSNVTGSVFTRAMKDASDLAVVMGTGIGGAVEMLGHVLQNPEHGLHRIAFRTGLFTQAEVAMIEQVGKGGNVLMTQTKILDLLEAKMAGTAEAASNTVQVKLMRLTQSWNLIGKSIGDAFLPLVDLAATVASAVVKAFGGGVIPIFNDVQQVVQGWVNSAKGWLDDNAGTFKTWAALLQDTAMNLYQGLKRTLGNLFGGINLGGMWEGFRKGVTDVLATVDALSANLGLTWDIVKTGGAIAWQYVKNKVLDAWDAVRFGWADALGAAWVTLEGWAGKIGSFLVTAFGVLFRYAGEKAAEAFKDAFSLGIGDWARKHPWIATALGGGPGFFLSLPKNEEDKAAKDAERQKQLAKEIGDAGKMLTEDDAGAKAKAAADERDRAKQAAGERQNELKDLQERMRGLLAELDVKRQIAQQAAEGKAGQKDEKKKPPIPEGARMPEGPPAKSEFTTGEKIWHDLALRSVAGGFDPMQKTADNTSEMKKLLEEIKNKLVIPGPVFV